MKYTPTVRRCSLQTDSNHHNLVRIVIPSVHVDVNSLQSLRPFFAKSASFIAGAHAQADTSSTLVPMLLREMLLHKL